MGCDIHAMIEKKSDYSWWVNSGDPEIGRDYELFSVLGNVRNQDNIPFIAKNREMAKGSCREFELLYKAWDSDAHSLSWVTLKELKEFDIDQEFEDTHLIISKDEKGNIQATCAMTNGQHEGPVGRRKIFALWGHQSWENLIKRMSLIAETYNKNDDEVRLVFFFDN